jgi:hypothetical protein
MPEHRVTPPRPELPANEELRATSDRMLAMVDELRALESEKRRHPVGSPAFLDTAHQAEELSRLIFRWSQMQGAMAVEAPSPARNGTIEEVPPRPIHRLLADWREAEIRLLAAAPGSPAADAATARIETMREEYRALMQRQRAEEQATT